MYIFLSCCDQLLPFSKLHTTQDILACCYTSRTIDPSTQRQPIVPLYFSRTRHLSPVPIRGKSVPVSLFHSRIIHILKTERDSKSISHSPKLFHLVIRTRLLIVQAYCGRLTIHEFVKAFATPQQFSIVSWKILRTTRLQLGDYSISTCAARPTKTIDYKQ